MKKFQKMVNKSKTEFCLSDSKPSKEVLDWFECRLFHEKTPILTGKTYLDEEGKSQCEIIHICKQCQEIKKGILNGKNAL
jgi:hypothetical protein